MARRNHVTAAADKLTEYQTEHLEDQTTESERTAAVEANASKPRLVWNPAMDEALTSVVRSTRNSAEVVRRLQSHEAFENFPASVITRLKVGTRLSKLRKIGVDVPKLQATGGGFGPVYVPDVERLNAILAEPVESTE